MNANPETLRAASVPGSLPTFRTERLLLRPRTLADLDACLAMDRDPAVARFVPGPWADPDRHRAFVVARMTADHPTGFGYWSIVPRRDPARFLGWVMLTPVEVGSPEVEIGWRLVRLARGSGYATAAARPVLGHAFGTVGLAEVVADIDPDNAPSIRVAQKLGMRAFARGDAGAGRLVRFVALRGTT